MKVRYGYVAALCVAMGMLASAAFAATVVVTTADNPIKPPTDTTTTLGWTQGWISPTDSSWSIMKDNYVAGRFQDFYGNNKYYRNYFSFDLSGIDIGLGVVSATLSVKRNDYRSDSGQTSFTYTLYDVSTEVVALNTNHNANSMIYDDLGTGVSYGAFAISSTGSATDILDFQLNGDALSAITGAAGSGWFSLGGSLTMPSGNTWESVFGGSGELAATLKLETGVVPEPSAALTLLGSLFSAAAFAWRKRSA